MLSTLPGTSLTGSHSPRRLSLDITEGAHTDADFLDYDALSVPTQTLYSDLSMGVEMASYDELSFLDCLPQHMDPALVDQDLDQIIADSALAASEHSPFSPIGLRSPSHGILESCNDDPVLVLSLSTGFSPIPSRQSPRYVSLLLSKHLNSDLKVSIIDPTANRSVPTILRFTSS